MLRSPNLKSKSFINPPTPQYQAQLISSQPIRPLSGNGLGSVKMRIASGISGAFSNSSVISLFQSAAPGSTGQSSDAEAAKPDSKTAASYNNAATKAIDSIIQIVMNSNGDTSADIDTDAAVTRVSTGAGNDKVAINATRAYAVTSGGGNDTISIKTTDDGKTNSSTPTVLGVGAGDGNDTINIDAHGVVMAVSGEAGNDTVNVKTDSLAFGVYGGEGNDTVNVDAKYAVNIDGGSGNDTVNVKASSIFGVGGGTGDDIINIDNTGNEAAQVFYSQGDGKDVINSNGAVSINLFTADGTKKLDMSNAAYKQDGNSVTISFGNDQDSITVNLTGSAAKGQASVSYDEKTGNLVIGPGSSQQAKSA